jgi:NTP pyrophosphatase (non-canonical NTP hydrolase)
MQIDQSTTIGELKEVAKQFCEARDWDQYHDARELAISMVIEASELLELFRFRSEEEVERMFESPEARGKVCDELADVMFALARFAQLYDIDVATAYFQKMAKNELKYPLDKSRGSNKKYDEL